MLVRALIFSTLISRLQFNEPATGECFVWFEVQDPSLIVLISEQEQTEAVFLGAASSQCKDNIVGRHRKLSPGQEPCCWCGC